MHKGLRTVVLLLVAWVIFDQQMFKWMAFVAVIAIAARKLLFLLTWMLQSHLYRQM